MQHIYFGTQVVGFFFFNKETFTSVPLVSLLCWIWLFCSVQSVKFEPETTGSTNHVQDAQSPPRSKRTHPLGDFEVCD